MSAREGASRTTPSTAARGFACGTRASARLRRRGEACGQPWSETNLDRHSLTVSGQLVQDGWEVEESEPKTDSGFRVVAPDDDTIGVLERPGK